VPRYQGIEFFSQLERGKRDVTPLYKGAAAKEEKKEEKKEVK
jgi:hypothetical protein